MPHITSLRNRSGKIVLAAMLLTTVSMPVLASPKTYKPAVESLVPKSVESAKPHLGIAAQVGDEAISSYDVENRIKFIVATAHLSNTPDVIEHIRPQVLRSLIDEKLELQEAAKNDITVNDQDVDQAISMIEQQREMPAGAIKHMLEGSNVPVETFTSQIRAQLSWNRLLTKKVRSQVRVSDAEILLASKKFVAAAPLQSVSVSQEYRIAVIAMPVDKPASENDVRHLGEKLVKEVRGGANFEEVSRQFSSSTASAGGKIETFWVRLNQVDPHIAHALQGAKTGAVTDPVRTSDGYTILKVYETRAIAGEKPAKEKPKAQKAVELKVKEYFIQSKAEDKAGDEGAMLSAANELTKNPGSCDDGKVPLIKSLDDFTVHTHLYQDSLPDAAKAAVESLAVGTVSSPITGADGVRVYVRCDPKSNTDKASEHEQLYGMLIQQKMELEAQKYLRNLRRETFIDVR